MRRCGLRNCGILLWHGARSGATQRETSASLKRGIARYQESVRQPDLSTRKKSSSRYPRACPACRVGSRSYASLSPPRPTSNLPGHSEKACTTPAVIHNDHFALPEAKHGQRTALRDRFDWEHVTRDNYYVKQQVMLFLCHISTVSKGVWKPVPMLPLLQWTKHILSGQTAPPDPAHAPQPPTPHQASP